MATLPSSSTTTLTSAFLHDPSSLRKPSSSHRPRSTLLSPDSICRASWQELAGVLIFSAIPFTAVKAIANSSLGESLRMRMEKRKRLAVENASKFRALAEQARKDGSWYGEERPRWLGPIPYISRVITLFEIFRSVGYAGSTWCSCSRGVRLNGRVLDLMGAFHFVEPVWWRVGYSKLKGDTLDYLGIPGLYFAGRQGVIVITICQVLLMVGPEYARYCGIEALEPLGIYLPGEINYPKGELIDPLYLSGDPVAFEELKLKEINNGRLAMVAQLGFFVQASLTGKGPMQNLLAHFFYPFHKNILSTLKSW